MDDDFKSGIAKKLSDSSKGRLQYVHQWTKDDLKHCFTDDRLRNVIQAHFASHCCTLSLSRSSRSVEASNPLEVGGRPNQSIPQACIILEKEPTSPLSEGNDSDSSFKIEQDNLMQQSLPHRELPLTSYTPFEAKAEKEFVDYFHRSEKIKDMSRRENVSEKVRLLEEEMKVLKQEQLKEEHFLQEKRVSERKELFLQQENYKRELLKEAESKLEQRIQEYKHQAMEVHHAAQRLEAKKREHVAILYGEVEERVDHSMSTLSDVLGKCSDQQHIQRIQQMSTRESEVLRGKLHRCRQDYDEEKHHMMLKEVETFNCFVKEMEQEVQKVNKALRDEAQRRLEEEKRQKKEKEERERKEREAKSVQPTPATPPSSVVSTTTATGSTSVSSSEGVLAQYLRLQEKKKQSEKMTEPFTTATDNKVKTYRFNLQKAVNTPVNSISTHSVQHLKDKVERLCQLLDGQRVEVVGVSMSIKTHPLAGEFCLNLLAKKFVNQGEKQVSSHFEAAFPIAAVILGVWSRHKNLGDFLLSHFHSVCPILVPLQVPTPPKIGEAEFKKLMSYRSNNNVPEDDSSYLKRMSGVVRLYAALVQSPGVVWGKANPLGIANGWKWLALVLNTDPLPGVTATVLFDFLEVAGHALWKEYRNQFEKLLCVLIKQYLPKIEAVTSAGQGGPTTRLRQFLDKCITSGSVPEPKGVLPAGLWRG